MAQEIELLSPMGEPWLEFLYPRFIMGAIVGTILGAIVSHCGPLGSEPEAGIILSHINK